MRPKFFCWNPSTNFVDDVIVKPRYYILDVIVNHYYFRENYCELIIVIVDGGSLTIVHIGFSNKNNCAYCEICYKTQL